MSLGGLGRHERSVLAPLLPPSFPTCPPHLGWERPPNSSNIPGVTPQALGCRTLPSGHRVVPASAHLDLVAPCPGCTVASGPPSCPGRGAGHHRQWPWMSPNRVHQSVHRSAASWQGCGVLAQLMLGTMPCTGGTPGLSHSATGLRSVEVCSGEGSEASPTAQHSPGPTARCHG